VRWGLCIGCGYGVLAIVAGQVVPDFEARYGLTLGLTILLDTVGGLLGGAVVGALLPRISGPVGFIVTAQASLLPAYCLFAVSVGPALGVDLIDGALAALVVGAFVGTGVWRRHGI
jgi:hypothetical protein